MGEILVFPVLLLARHLELSALVSFFTWPIVLALFMANKNVMQISYNKTEIALSCSSYVHFHYSDSFPLLTVYPSCLE